MLPWTCGCVILRSLSRDGLARESAAVAPCGVLWLTNGLRPVSCLPVRMWLKRGLRCRKLHCPPRPGGSGREEVICERRRDDRRGPAQGQQHGGRAGPVTKTLIDTARFANTDEGYARLAGFARRWDCRRWAVEGCRGAGRSLAQRLVADGELVLDVPAKLAARVRVYSQGHGRKTDRDDAVSIGLAALRRHGTGFRSPVPGAPPPRAVGWSSMSSRPWPS